MVEHDELLEELGKLDDAQQPLERLLADSAALLGLLPRALVSADATTAQRAQRFRRVMQKVVETARAKLDDDPGDMAAHYVMAAGAIFGLVVDPPGSTPSGAKVSLLKETRQRLAAQWLPRPRTTARRFRDERAACIEAFGAALLQWLEGDAAVMELGRELGLRTGQLGDQEAEVPPPAPVGSGDGEPDDKRSRWWRFSHKRTAVLALAGLLVAVAAVVSAIVFSSSGSDGEGSPPSQSEQSPSTATSVAMFRFDSLGSTYSSIIQVYPGVKPTKADRTSNGTFKSGDTVRAVCITTGRLVKSDPTYGETPRQSDQWVQIAAVPGVVQYATLTYGSLVPTNDKLPRCNDVQ
jgi:hypothetical protein